jgi:hypothetical protein
MGSDGGRARPETLLCLWFEHHHQPVFWRGAVTLFVDFGWKFFVDSVEIARG